MPEMLSAEGKSAASESLGRGVIAIVITGVVLGLAHNQMGRAGKPPRGLTWIAEKKDIVELENLPGASGAEERSTSPAAVDLDDPLGGVVAAEGGASLPEIPDLGQPIEVKVSVVKAFFDAGAALIVDSRDAEDFAQGHIPGALNLPYEQAASDPARLEALDPGGRPLIIYCGGGTCEASMRLAEALLYQAGKRRVLVYEGGWPEWTERGYPVEKGTPR